MRYYSIPEALALLEGEGIRITRRQLDGWIEKRWVPLLVRFAYNDGVVRGHLTDAHLEAIRLHHHPIAPTTIAAIRRWARAKQFDRVEIVAYRGDERIVVPIEGENS